MVHANAFEQGDIFGGNTTRAFGLEGVSRDSRQNAFQVFQQRVWSFHGRPLYYWIVALRLAGTGEPRQKAPYGRWQAGKRVNTRPV
ncbi:hypothetical protein D3C76_1447410 [compost metagenome]